jgi:group I intron endonuclease
MAKKLPYDGRCYLYSITNMLNNKRYIGLAKDPVDRWRKHRNAAVAARKRQVLHTAMAKHGTDAFAFEVIACCGSWADGLFVERLLIRQFDCRATGYNSTHGGEGVLGLVHSAEALAANRAAHLGKKASPEVRAKLSVASASRLRGSLSDAHRAAISASLKGRPGRSHTEASRAKMSLVQSGPRKPLTDAHKAALSAVRGGKKRPPFSAAWRAAISAAHLGKRRGPYSEARRAALVEAWVRRRAKMAPANG